MIGSQEDAAEPLQQLVFEQQSGKKYGEATRTHGYLLIAAEDLFRPHDAIVKFGAV